MGKSLNYLYLLSVLVLYSFKVLWEGKIIIQCLECFFWRSGGEVENCVFNPLVSKTELLSSHHDAI